MTGYDVFLLGVKAVELGGAGKYVAMAGAVKSVAAYAVGFVILVWQSVGVGIVGHCLME